MRVLLWFVLLLAQFAMFLVITLLSAKVYPYLAADTYDGREPRENFPVVAVRQPAPDAATAQYQLLRWSEMAKSRGENPPPAFKLPAAEGQFDLDARGSYQPFVRFKVLESTSAGQLVEVFWSDKNFEIVAKYFTDGTTVQPRYLRTMSIGNVFAGALPGLIAAWLLGWVARRRWPRLGLSYERRR